MPIAKQINCIVVAILTDKALEGSFDPDATSPIKPPRLTRPDTIDATSEMSPNFKNDMSRFGTTLMSE